MKLFRISQKEVANYDFYDSAVVAAPDEETARNMHPEDGQPIEVDWDKQCVTYTWCKSLDEVTVEYLGEAVAGTEQGVICASFIAR